MIAISTGSIESTLIAVRDPDLHHPRSQRARNAGWRRPTAVEWTAVAVYVPESFTSDEADVLRRYFTNLDGPVFALVNLPEVVKGALFARYSRSPKSLRRLFLDEFVGDLDISGDLSVDATVGLDRAEELYERVFFDYGDDSVAQLGGVHLACEQASNILTKVLEWGRLMSYLEQSTRYIAYDSRLGGRYRYFRDPDVLASPLGTRYVGDLDRIFDSYSNCTEVVTEHVRNTVDRGDSSEFVYRTATKAKALDAVRGMLPAAATSNVGIYGTGQAFEALLLRMRASPLPESREYADLMLHELRKVIPSFLRRVDLPNRGGKWSEYLAATRADTRAVVDELFGETPVQPASEVELVDFDPDAEDKILAAICYSHSTLPEHQLVDKVRDLGVDEKVALMRAYIGRRENRRHKPGRAFERSFYRFDVLSDYGAFRDMQRHRMLTIEWQRLTPNHGYSRPELVEEAGAGAIFDEAMQRSAALYDALNVDFFEQAPYAVSMAYRMRYSMQFNAREAIHMLELRSSPQGHPSYRRVALEMHRLIAEQAGHHALAAAMNHMTTEAPELERLESEQRAEARRDAADS
ncbi:MAG: thymidylate synthase [Ilumatobacter sp.]|nr:thymidylate synthase [Ilumatobacter sp.]